MSISTAPSAPSAELSKVRIENAVAQIILAMGISPFDNPDFVETPSRVARMFAEFWKPASMKPVDVLKEGFDHEDRGTGGMVVQTNIPYRGLCPHHLLPVFGTAALAYVPNKRIAGLSKLARLVDAASTRKPDTQEAVTNDVADALMEGMEPLGAIVVTDCVHTCMLIRGVRAVGTRTKVSAIRGVFRDVPAARQEFFALIRDL